MDKFISPKNKNVVIVVLAFALVASIAIAVYYYKKSSNLTEFDDRIEKKLENNPTESSKPTLVLFWAKWCSNCTIMKGEWEKAVNILNKEGIINVLDFEADRDQNEIQSAVGKYPGMGYPHIRFFPNGYGGDKPSIQFGGPRTEQSFVAFVHKNLNSDDKEISQTPI